MMLINRGDTFEDFKSFKKAVAPVFVVTKSDLSGPRQFITLTCMLGPKDHNRPYRVHRDLGCTAFITATKEGLGPVIVSNVNNEHSHPVELLYDKVPMSNH